VNTEGQFVLPPAHVTDPSQPEVMGLSSGGVFVTKQITQDEKLISVVACLPFPKRAVALIQSDSVLESEGALPASVSSGDSNAPTIVISLMGALLLVALVVFIVATIIQKNGAEKP